MAHCWIITMKYELLIICVRLLFVSLHLQDMRYLASYIKGIYVAWSLGSNSSETFSQMALTKKNLGKHKSMLWKFGPCWTITIPGKIKLFAHLGTMSDISWRFRHNQLSILVNLCIFQFRGLAVYISVNQYFDYVVMLTILANCAFLAMTEPVDLAE